MVSYGLLEPELALGAWLSHPNIKSHDVGCSTAQQIFLAHGNGFLERWLQQVNRIAFFCRLGVGGFDSEPYTVHVVFIHTLTSDKSQKYEMP